MVINKRYDTINVSNILNYSENPRHDIGTNQIDTIRKLINKVGSQYMYNLASDIYRNGLLGANLPVLVHDSEKKKYIVYEGNRRVACIKFLNEPDILTTIDKALKQRIEKLKNEEKSQYSSEIYCLITEKDEAFTIMERTHSGEDKGRGTKAWTSKEKAVFKSRLKDKITIELVIADHFEKYFKEDITKKISYTTIQRFFNNREVKKAININSEFSNISEEKTILIKYLINKAIEESEKKNVTLTRLFNRAREIEDFFVPLINQYNLKLNDLDKGEESERKSNENTDLENTDLDDNNSTQETDANNYPFENDTEQFKDKKEKDSIRFKIKNKSNNVYCTEQTINLHENLEITNREAYNSELLDIESADLRIIKGIVQPHNVSGEYKITYKYYLDMNKKNVFWQDNTTLILRSKRKSFASSTQQTVLSDAFRNKYLEKTQFEHGDKLRPLIAFLSSENKNGKYSNLLNIVSRMFLEYSFRMYASKILKQDNRTIDEKSKSLKGFIDGCCNIIEQEDSDKFVRHIKSGRKDATNKVELLQKSIHYFDVSISNEDIQTMFANLNIYLEYVYNKLIEENQQNSLK